MKGQKNAANYIRKGKKNKRIKKLRTSDFIAFILLLFFAVLAGINIKDYIGYYRLDFIQPVTGTLTDQISVQALVVRSETFVQAPKDGEFTPICEEGERVRCGTVIGYITDEKNGIRNKLAVLAPASGTVHYKFDGLEGILSADTLGEVSLDQVFATLGNGLNQETEPMLQEGKGHHVAKIIDNLDQYRVILALEDKDPYSVNSKISFALPDGDIVTGSISDKLETATSVYLIVGLSAGIPYLTENRAFTAQLILNQYNGLIIPKSAVTKDKTGSTGVFEKGSGELRFCPITIQGMVGDQVAVTGQDLKEVVSNPQRAYDGQKLY